ncbi:uncharacterized protein VTP21DRAFT_4219 [Calcarisporiella thermophila]|uniref:uncharacterized protein n=1 Tax=Calcarisporiella thermophila TaxID=911321 RepID=UPI003743F7D6
MSSDTIKLDEIDELKARIAKLELENKQLKELLQIGNVESSLLPESRKNEGIEKSSMSKGENRLNKEEIMRYGRQLILDGFGMKGQLKLRQASILIVGAGGLGAPAALYLAGAGVGEIGIVDYDTVDTSNLHRQIIHGESRTGISKVVSAKMAIEDLNPTVTVHVHDLLIDSSNALNLIKPYDLVLDCTDNAATRYLLNDACVMLGKPLVSGSALRTEGQLTVYNWKGGPCYRCLYPTPPPPETVQNCSDNGVLGVVPGIIGCLQALEAIKILAEIQDQVQPWLLLFSATTAPMFRHIKLRARRHDCSVCGENPTQRSLIDYVAFCGRGALDKTPDITVLSPQDRITVQEYNKDRTSPHLLLDVREKVQYEICALDGSVNVPIKQLESRIDEVRESIKDESKPVYVICRLGNDSQLAVDILRRFGIISKDIIGGLRQWSREIDSDFPVY